MCTGADLDVINGSEYKSLQVMRRALDIVNYQKSMGYIETARLDYPDVNMRYIVAPLTKLDHELVPIGFDQADKMIKTGLRDAQRTVALGEGKMKDYLLEHKRETRMNCEDEPEPIKQFIERKQMEEYLQVSD